MLKKSKNKSGFTLIELLVVVAVISILLAIIVPSYNKVKQKASAVVCLSNLSQWYIVVNLSTNDRNGYFHTGWAGQSNSQKSEWWMGHLRNYYDNIEEFRCCPIAKKTSKSPPFAAWDWNKSQDVDVDVGSYLMNGWVENKQNDFFDESERQLCEISKDNYWRNIKKVRNASKVPLMTDSNWLDGWPEPHDYPPYSRDANWMGMSSHFGRICVDRHYKRQNMLFMDGSVETIDLKQLWTLKWHRNYNTAGQWTLAGGATHDQWEQQAEWMADYKDY